MRDFTLDIYSQLLKALKASNFEFQTVSDFLKEPKQKVVMLRHDVDDKKQNSLTFARIQHAMGISATYYFRILPQSFDISVIKEIHSLGHEIGYHYEDMDLSNGILEEAIISFEMNLTEIRKIAPISSICMHGSPKSTFDNRKLWDEYDYKKYDILGEPYFDFDFETIFYATDTGRMWDGSKFSIRDYVNSLREWPTFHGTNDIIETIEKGDFPVQAMLTFHPQRWTNDKKEWMKELINQKIKNFIKYVFFKRN